MHHDAYCPLRGLRSYEWREGDSQSWLADLAPQLPGDRAVWKGVYPDYSTMTAETPLWRLGDANACPTGGRANIVLGWSFDRVVLRSVQVERAGECGEPTPYIRPGSAVRAA